MSGGGTQSLARLLCKPGGLNWFERFNDQADGATSDTGATAWALTPSAAAASYGVAGDENTLRMYGNSAWQAVIPNSSYTGPVLVDIVAGQIGVFQLIDVIQFTYQVGSGTQFRFAEIRQVQAPNVVQAVVDAVAGQSITIRVQCQTTDFTRRIELSHVRLRAIKGGAHWAETFEDLANGATVDNGDTAWTRTVSGTGAVADVVALSSGNGKAFRISRSSIWQSEVIALPVLAQGGVIDLFVRVRTEGNSGLSTDDLTGQYRINGGAWVNWFVVSNVFTDMITGRARVANTNATSIQLRAVCDTSLLSANRYLIDEIRAVAYC
ncbi:MAG: hypothetical protein ACOYB0_08185 [Polynucleobacter sp.]